MTMMRMSVSKGIAPTEEADKPLAEEKNKLHVMSGIVRCADAKSKS